MSLFTARAILPGSVHGVVVQARNTSPFSLLGNFTVALKSLTSSYPWATSWELSVVWQQGQYGLTR
ncbi:hypothetical protein D3C81_2100160 [compost metagenome]